MLRIVLAGLLLWLVSVTPASAISLVRFVNSDGWTSITWQGATYRSDGPFLLRMEGDVIRERWTFPDVMTAITGTPQGIKVRLKTGRTLLWRPGAPIPISQRDVWTVPRCVGPTWPFAAGEPKATVTQYQEASRLDPTNPWFHLWLAQHHAQAGEGAVAQSHLTALMASPHLTWRDWARLMVPLEVLHRPDLATIAYHHARGGFRQAGYQPELIQFWMMGKILFWHPDFPLATLKRQAPDRYVATMRRIAQFVPHTEAVSGLWAGLAIDDPQHAGEWQALSQSAKRWDLKTPLWHQENLAIVISLALLLTIWILSLAWAVGAPVRTKAVVSLLVLLVVANGFARRGIAGYDRVSHLPLAATNGDWSHPDVVAAIRSWPPSPDRDTLLAACQSPSALAGANLDPAGIIRAATGPLSLSLFVPAPAGAPDELIYRLVMRFKDAPAAYRASKDHGFSLGLIAAWGLCFIGLRRRALPKQAALALPGLADTAAASAPWVMAGTWMAVIWWAFASPDGGAELILSEMGWFGTAPVRDVHTWRQWQVWTLLTLVIAYGWNTLAFRQSGAAARK